MLLLDLLQMENAAAAAYATNPQLPPSLVVFSQAGDTLSDVLTMQRTFNPQVSDKNPFLRPYDAMIWISQSLYSVNFFQSYIFFLVLACILTV